MSEAVKLAVAIFLEPLTAMRFMCGECRGVVHGNSIVYGECCRWGFVWKIVEFAALGGLELVD